MKHEIKIKQFARKLVELSKEDGIVTEAKVKETLEALKKVQHRHHLIILKTFLNYIRREISQQTAVVFTPSTLSDDTLKSIESQFTSQYNRPIRAILKNDHSLIAGVRVRIGDDMYDASVAGRLQRLAENVK